MSNWQEQQKQVATGVTDGSRKTPQTEALKLALAALEKVVAGWTQAFAEYKYDSDIPSENQYRDEVFAAITAIKEALAQPEQERCVGCEACIDTACGRDECPKGWPKAVQPELEPVAYCNGMPAYEGPLSKTQRKEPEQEEYLSKAYRLANELRCHLAIAPAPQRTWVGLTDEEKQEWIDAMPYDPQPRHCMTLVNIIESKLKEKNT